MIILWTFEKTAQKTRLRVEVAQINMMILAHILVNMLSNMTFIVSSSERYITPINLMILARILINMVSK